MKYIYAIILIFLSIIIYVFPCCDSSEEKSMPLSPIFSDVKSIDIQISGDSFSFYLPDEVSYAVLGVFSSSIAVDDDGKAVKDDNLVAGSRTGFDTWARSGFPKYDIYEYVSSQKDFNRSSVSSFAGITYSWAVWGYDSYGNLTHASGQDEVTY